jgi:hypothetical protein
MMFILLGLLAAGAVWWGLHHFGTDEAKIKLLKKGGGALAFGFALVLLLKGRFDMAIGLAGLGAYLLSGSVSGLFHSQFNGRSPFGGEAHNADADAGRAQHGTGAGMTEDEAYQVLGLEKGASLDAIHRSHRELMKKIHPDQGGTTYLATRVNQARDVLLKAQG